MDECTSVRNELGVYLVGAITPADRARVARHLPCCERCRDEVAGLAALPGLLRRQPAEPGEPAMNPDPPGAFPGSLASRVARRRRTRLWLTTAAVTSLAGPGTRRGPARDETDRWCARAHRRSGAHRVLVRARQGDGLPLRRHLRRAVAAGTRAGPRGSRCARDARDNHPSRRHGAGHLGRASPLHRHPGHHTRPGQRQQPGYLGRHLPRMRGSGVSLTCVTSLSQAPRVGVVCRPQLPPERLRELVETAEEQGVRDRVPLVVLAYETGTVAPGERRAEY